MRKKKSRQRTITGVIVPEDWDADDKVIRVGIKTSDYREYIIEYNRQGRELMSLINHQVRVTGKIRERLDGEFMLNVEGYELVGDKQEGQHVARYDFE